MKRPRVIIANLERQHSHQTALALQEGGMLEKYLTTLWYQPNRFPYSLIPSLPHRIKMNLLRELGKHSFEQLNEDKIETHVFAKFLAAFPKRIIRLAGINEWIGYLLEREFDRWVSRRLSKLECDLFIGYESSSLLSFGTCKKKNIIRILDHAACHWSLQKKILKPRVPSIPSRLWEARDKTKARELDLADLILTPSGFSKQSFVEGGIPEEKLIQIPYGVDTTLFKPKQNGANPSFTILYVGLISLRKGFQFLLESFRQLGLAGARLLLIGPMSDGKEVLEKYKSSCTYLSHIDQKELPRFYQEADLFVMPSFDSFGMVVLEAMASGTPVIVSSETGAKDVVREGVDGFVVPSGNVEALKEKIQFSYDHRDVLKTMGRNAGSRAREYSWERYRSSIREGVTSLWQHQAQAR